MYSFANVEAGSPGELWSLVAARRQINEAIAAFEAAGAALIPLIADSSWAADGVRALHALLEEFQQRASHEIGQLNVREWELEQMGDS